jgi:hypothetical protein
LLQISNCERRCKTDLEDIGDGDGVLGGLALGGDDGNGRPRHGVLWWMSNFEIDGCVELT